MEHFEKEILPKDAKNPEIWLHYVHYVRYVDNIFMIWRHGRAELCNFLIFLNNKHPGMPELRISPHFRGFWIEMRRCYRDECASLLRIYRYTDSSLEYDCPVPCAIYFFPQHRDCRP